MSRQLTKQETKELFKVCERHNVPQYDLQIELVDHMATSIEQHWIEKPEDPFKYALYKAIQKFGSAGFNKVKEQKERALARKYRRLLWHYLLKFYRWPKMLLTAILGFGVFLSLKNIELLHWIFASYMLVLIAIAVIYDLRFKKKQKVKVIPGKSFLLLDQLKEVQLLAMIFCNLPTLSFLPFTLLRENTISMPNNSAILFLIAVLTVSLTIVLFGYFFYIPKKIKEHFMEQFSEFAV